MAEPGISAPEPGRERRLQLTAGWPAFVSLALVFVVLRVPSLVEPPTFNDEGSYADIGWALDHGAVLYRDVWAHYTPGVYWLGAAINLVHASVLAFHVVLAAAVALTALGIWLYCVRFASRRVAWGATLAFIVLAALPTFEGDVFYVEIIGALLVVWAMLLVARRGNVAWFAASAAGLLLSAAVLFKVTFAADAVAVATIPIVIAVASGRRPGRAEARTASLVALGAMLLIGVAASALWLGGSMPGLLDVLLRQDEAYLSVSSGGASGGVALAGGSAQALFVMTVTRIALVLVVGTALTWWLARRRRLGASIAAWWLTWDLAAVVVSGLGLAHYVQQAEPALCICAGLLAEPLFRRLPARNLALAFTSTVAAWAVCVAALIAPTAEASIVASQPISTFASAIVSPRAVTHYLGRGWQRALGLITPAVYDSGIGTQAALVRKTVMIIEAHSRRTDRVFVWGRLPWAYALSGRLPAGRYVSLNSAYSLDPGAQRLLIGELRKHPPVVLIALDALPSEVSAMLKGLHYTRLPECSGAERCWVLPTRR